MSTQQRGDMLDWTKLRPPAYLLGTTLIIWGFLSKHPLLGITAGLLLEAHRWMPWRWKFSDQDYIRVWNLCVVLFLIVAVFQVVDRDFGRWQITRVFQVWMPVLLFPMILAQYFTRGKDVPFLTFSLVARRKRLYDERAGRRTKEARRAHLGYFYFAILLLSIGAAGREAPPLGEFLTSLNPRKGIGSVSSVYVLVSAVLAWAFTVFVSKRGWMLAGALFIVSLFVGHHLHHGLRYLHYIVEHKTLEWISGRNSADANSTRTQFGKVGELKLTPKVFWRAKLIEGKPPSQLLLPEAIYQTYNDSEWHNTSPISQLEEVDKVENRDQWEIENIGTAEAESVMDFRGRVSSREETLPRMEGTGIIYDLEASNLEKNRAGSLIVSPSYSTLKYRVYAGKLSPGKLEGLPKAKDLRVAPRERPSIEEHTSTLKVSKTASTRERIQAVEQFFANPANNFTYSKHLQGTGSSNLGQRRSHLGNFLSERGRSGHCEYYGTATVLMLRQLGVKARYVIGYALKEFDKESDEWVMRGTHRHAWARAWLEEEERWINVDTTPNNWFDLENDALSPYQKFMDRWDHWMLSWNLWRRADNKGLLWTLLPVILAGGLLIVVALRLIRGLRKSHKEDRPGKQSGNVHLLGMDSAWFELEESLAAQAWPRTPSQSVGDWCQQLIAERPEWTQILRPIVSDHYRYRFDPAGLSEQEITAFQDSVGAFRESLVEQTN